MFLKITELERKLILKAIKTHGETITKDFRNVIKSGEYSPSVEQLKDYEKLKQKLIILKREVSNE